MAIRISMLAGLLALASSQPGWAAELADYTVEGLLKPCVEGDNDSRWGAAAEAECEQYIMGFTDALVVAGSLQNICLPANNRPDEVRWAFVKWAHQHYDDRRQPAATGLMRTLEAEFACK